MLGPLDIVFEEYGISPRTGFLPEEPPQRLSSIYYKDWEDIVCQLPILLRTNQLRAEIENLPVLSVSSFLSESEWQRAYVLLSFMTHGYIWGGQYPAEVLPRAISIPYLAVSKHLSLPPTATYAALNLWNFSSVPGFDLSRVENSHMLYTLTGTSDEAWFYQVSVAIEARGGSIIPVIVKAINAAREDDPQTIISCLCQLADCIEELGIILERMYEGCSPEIFYHRIRPFLAGSKNMASAGLPNGVFYEEDDGKGQWHQYSGGSNAQSSLIQLFDIVLGVSHSPMIGSKTGAVAPKQKHNFLEEMRGYMPEGHRLFLQEMDSVSNIREFVQGCSPTGDITAAYNLAVARLGCFRDLHIQMVTRYIIGPSRRGPQTLNGGMNLAIGSTNKTLKKGLAGTGGTELMPFLKQSRDETKRTGLSRFRSDCVSDD